MNNVYGTTEMNNVNVTTEVKQVHKESKIKNLSITAEEEHINEQLQDVKQY